MTDDETEIKAREAWTASQAETIKQQTAEIERLKVLANRLPQDCLTAMAEIKYLCIASHNEKRAEAWKTAATFADSLLVALEVPGKHDMYRVCEMQRVNEENLDKLERVLIAARELDEGEG